MDNNRTDIQLNEIIAILWRRKWVLIIIPLIAIVAAYIFSQTVTPRYTSSAQVALGSFNSPVYTEVEAARQIFLSRDTLEPVLEELDLEFSSLSEFRDAISVQPVDRTKIIKVEATYPAPETAQQIVDALVDAFMQRSGEIYGEKKGLLEDYLQLLEERHEQLSQSIERYKDALTELEKNTQLSEQEKELTRVRLLDYLAHDEMQLTSLVTRIHDTQNTLLELEPAQVIEQSNLPQDPSYPRTLLNLVLAAVAGGFLALFIVFLAEYFSRHPVRFKSS